MKSSIPALIIDTLSRLGVTHLFHLPGTSVAGLYGILAQQKKIKSVLCRHEQAACFAAAGYALTTNRPGVCMVMCGPGVTNLVSAVAECWYQSVPLVVITVDNPRKTLGSEAFHEVDSFSMLAPVTKKIICPAKARDIQAAVTDAITSASSGRPGPVYLNLPMDMMDRTATLRTLRTAQKPQRPALSTVRQALKLIRASREPVIFAGSGVLRSGAEKELLECVRLSGIPVLTSLGGRGAVPEGSDLVMGMPSYTFDMGFLKAADLFLVLGTRLNPVNLRMGKLPIPGNMIQVDTDTANPKFRKPDLYIRSDVKEFLKSLNREIHAAKRFPRYDSAVFRTYRQQYAEFTTAQRRRILSGPARLTSQRFLLELSHFLEKKDAVLFTDSIWTPFPHLLPQARKPRSFFSMRSFGCLGFALPAAIGACLVNRRKKVISLSGDGAFLFNCQDLSTAATYKVKNFVQIILNNSGYSSLHGLASSRFNGQDEYYLWSDIDYKHLAESLGVRAMTVRTAAGVRKALTAALDGSGPCVINVMTADRGALKKAFWAS